MRAEWTPRCRNKKCREPLDHITWVPFCPSCIASGRMMSLLTTALFVVIELVRRYLL